MGWGVQALFVAQENYILEFANPRKPTFWTNDWLYSAVTGKPQGNRQA